MDRKNAATYNPYYNPGVRRGPGHQTQRSRIDLGSGSHPTSQPTSYPPPESYPPPAVYQGHVPHHGGYVPQEPRPIIQSWKPDIYGKQYSEVLNDAPVSDRHSSDPATAAGLYRDRFNEYVDRTHIPKSTAPFMVAVTMAQEPQPRAFYGTSAPPPRKNARAQKLREQVVQERLDAIPSHLYEDIDVKQINTKNMPGCCCEFVTIPPFMLQGDGTLRTAESFAMELYTGFSRAFCKICGVFAGNVAEFHPGLRIVDKVSGVVYQSQLTADAFARRDAGHSVDQIEPVLRAEAQRIALSRAPPQLPAAQTQMQANTEMKIKQQIRSHRPHEASGSHASGSNWGAMPVASGSGSRSSKHSRNLPGRF